MGDRANVLVKGAGCGDVYLYTHWNGTELPAVVYRALKKHWRWRDPSYLARIIFCEMIKNDVDGETGFGISHVVGDGAERIVEVDCDAGMVRVGRGKRYTFADFIAKDPDDIEWEFER